MKLKDLAGQKFGKLTALYQLHNNHTRHTYWLCTCDCGNLVEIRSSHLRSGNTKSCGCLRNAIITKHGKHNTRLYRIWAAMKRRCYNKSQSDYKNYGARSIKICDEWRRDFKAFYNWAIDNNYQDNLTIDRIDVNGNYEPSNCRWSTIKQQANNRRTTKYITYQGETKSLSEWCELFNLKYHTIKYRLNELKWPIEKALFTPVKK